MALGGSTFTQKMVINMPKISSYQRRVPVIKCASLRRSGTSSGSTPPQINSVLTVSSRSIEFIQQVTPTTYDVVEVSKTEVVLMKDDASNSSTSAVAKTEAA